MRLAVNRGHAALNRAYRQHCLDYCNAQPMALMGLVSRISPVQTAVCNCTRDEGGPFGIGNQLLISSHRKLLWSKATVVNVAEKPDQGVRQA